MKLDSDFIGEGLFIIEHFLNRNGLSDIGILKMK